MEIEEQWMCGRTEDTEVWTAVARFNSREKAIFEGREASSSFNLNGDTVGAEDILGYYPTEEITSFAIGRIVPAVTLVDAEDILERIGEDMWEQVGEAAEDYLQDVSQEDQDELADLIREWIDKKGYGQRFFTLEDIETIRVFEEETE